MTLINFTAACPATVELQDACGLPLGLVVQPLAQPEGESAAPPACWAADLARCARCHAYINSLCDVDDQGWGCSLCGCSNDFSTATSLRRYYGAAAERLALLPELVGQSVDVLCPLVAADPDEGVEEVLALEAQPAVLAVVDACCSEEGLELVKSALAAAVEALPPAARFGLVSFGSQINLHRVSGGNGSGVLHIPLAGSEAAQVSLQEAAPLGRMLASVGSYKEAILAAVEQLEIEPQVGGGRERALGDTLRAVLRWLAVGAPSASAEGLQRQSSGGSESEQSGDGNGGLPAAQGFPGMRLLLFLAGPPNCGAGAVVARRPSPAVVAAAQRAQQQAAEQAARELATLVLDPQYPELSAWTDVVYRTTSAQRSTADAAAAAALAAAGDLSHAAPPGIPAEQLEVNLAARDFYAEAGAAAAALGVTVDLFAAGPLWMGLDFLEPLASTSGGSVLLYRSLETAAMTQDVYKLVTQPRALACLLRLRCSPELELRGAHGRLMADKEHPDLFRLVACGSDDAFAFDLDRSTQRVACTAPAVQLVLQYSVLLPVSAAPDSTGSDGSRFVLQRRMRIITSVLPLASSAAELFASCDCEAIACLVVHKSLATAAEQGVREARQMLFDWLALITAAAAEHCGGVSKGQAAPVVDASLSELHCLHHLPHMLFSLLYGPLLQEPGAVAAAGASGPLAQPAAWRHPDAAAALRSLLRALPPDELAVAVCPQLSSWASPDQVAVPRHSLSAAALAVSHQPIWVLDSYSELIVFYMEGRGPAPFPPPAASLLRRTLAGMRAARRCTPELLLLREGGEGTEAFADWLIEDPSAAGAANRGPQAGGSSGEEGEEEGGAARAQQAQKQRQQQQPLEWPTFVEFLYAVNAEAQTLLA